MLAAHTLSGSVSAVPTGGRAAHRHLALKLPFEGVDKEQMNPMDAKKKNLVIAGVVAAALSLAVGTVAAQDYFSPLFSAYVDHVVPGDSPCGATPIRTITPSTYDETVMLWYLCEDNRVIARRFFRAGGGAQVPQPVYLVNPPDVSSTSSTPAPSAPSPSTSSCAAYPGFVPAVNGGCVPPDHPLASGR
jgi:hypothetical protein